MKGRVKAILAVLADLLKEAVVVYMKCICCVSAVYIVVGG